MGSHNGRAADDFWVNAKTCNKAQGFKIQIGQYFGGLSRQGHINEAGAAGDV